MCYSAQVEEAYRVYLRMTGAEMDYAQFIEIYGSRARGDNIRIPRGFDRNFSTPKSPEEQTIKALIEQHRLAQTAKLEQELFAQKKRLADAERKLALKQTKAAAESRRIALSKAEQIVGKLNLLNDPRPHKSDGRVFPMQYAPIVVNESGRKLVKLARYHCRLAGKPDSVDRQFPGLYNARRDNIERYWGAAFGKDHALMLVHSFYENVERGGRNAVLHFVPKPAGLMLIACLYSRWIDPKDGKELLSFAAITDEPPAEVAAAGHDRMIVSIKPENVERWLAPRGRALQDLQAILSDRQAPYYEHEVLAA